MPERPILSLAEIDAFDPQGPPARKWCPLCGDAKPKDAAHRSLSIDRSSGLWKCFRCNESGQAREFWASKPLDSPRARRATLRAAFGAPLSAASSLIPTPTPPSAGLPVQVQTQPVTSDWKPLWEQTLPLESSPGALYLARRAITTDVAALAGVRWSTSWILGGAVVFPVQNHLGEMIAAQGRAVRGSAKITKGPKKEGAFFAPVTLSSGRVCGPLDEAAPAIVLTEAPIDALSIAACGFPALALCGTAGPNWLHLACGLRKVVLAFDADEAGDRAARDMEKRLEPYGARCSRLQPEEFKDWNEWLVRQGRGELNDWLAARLLML
jgi:hypothetical protein